MMRTQLGGRFWVKAILSAASAAALAATLVWKDWIEAVFAVDPDYRSGAIEWAIAVALGAMTFAFAALAAGQVPVIAREEG